MIKTPIAKLFIGLFTALLMGSILSSAASAAAPAPPKNGCFNNGLATACPPEGTVDTNNNTIEGNSNCYSYNGPTGLVGASGTWTEVLCSNLTTPITSSTTQYYCGGPSDEIDTSIDFGCQHKGNPILDMLFAIIRLLSDGVGVVVIASVVVGGIQYTTSAGDPNAVAKAVGRIRASLLALVIFIFAYAIVNYVLPGAFLK
jgi:hypothetical protein